MEKLCSLCCQIDLSQNVGLHFETWNAGVLGPVTLKGLNEGTRDLSGQKWSYKVCFPQFVLYVCISIFLCSTLFVYTILENFGTSRLPAL